LIPLGVIGSIYIGIVLLVFVNKKSSDTPYIIILNLEDLHEGKSMIEFWVLSLE